MTASEEHLDFHHDAVQGGGQKRPDTPRPGYFQRGGVSLLVAINGDAAPTDWNTWLESLGKHCELQLPLKLARLDGENYVPPMKLAGKMEGVDRFLIRTQIAPDNDLFKNDDSWYIADQMLVDTVNQMNTYAGARVDQVTFQAVAPNWYLASANHTLTHGGPGALPVRATAPARDEDRLFDMADVNTLLGGCGAERTVVVVILDTVPPARKDAINPPDEKKEGPQGIYHRFPADTHKIVEGLNPHLHVRRPPAIELPPDISHPPHAATKYDALDMSDHGSFIAGIINSIAPTATIKLVEALNKHGVGTTDVFAECLNLIASGAIDVQKPESPEKWSLIINCSLTIDIPRFIEDGKICELEYPHIDEKLVQSKNAVVKLNDAGQEAMFLRLESQSLLAPARAALEHFNQVFAGYDVQIVAAAGNEGQPGAVPPPACYPAAFGDVLGVGAFEDGLRRAYYSNVADEPASGGVVVFGGMATPKSATNTGERWNETDAAKGILGLYVGTFTPKDIANGKVQAGTPSAGWARWAGTSFSTGVMSGVLAYAALNGCKVSIKADDGFYKNLIRDTAIIRPDKPRRTTKYNELTLNVPQGTAPVAKK